MSDDFNINKRELIIATFFIGNHILNEANLIDTSEDGQQRLIEICDQINNNERTTVDGIGELSQSFADLDLDNVALIRRDFVRVEKLIASAIKDVDALPDPEDLDESGEAV